jgi:citronellol/citronellal dehydrogenase
MADSAYVILGRNSRDYTGNFALDEDVLREAGVQDFAQYAYDPSWFFLIKINKTHSFHTT